MAAEIITENAQIVKALKNVLQSLNVLDKRHKIAKIGPKFHIRSVSSPEEIRKILSEYIDQVSISGVEETSSPAIDDQSLTGLVMQYFDQHSSPQELNHPLATFLEKLPKKWSTYPPMVLFNTGTFDSDIWTNVFETQIDRSEFLSFIARAFPGKITHFAINKPIIEEDEMRRPFNLVPLSGDFGPEPTETLFCSPSPC
ncbi:hypothetical protein JCM33374_g1495 [Metschnikowia sp. JCM 33374]|nr:hypothetical protein JCM33374_g1495 [Metschnikowia sp. JCM 33374]